MIKSSIQIENDHIEQDIPSLLIIDHDPEFSELLLRQGRDRGFQCWCTTDAREGFQMACLHRPSAIILDVELSQMDGQNIIQLLEQDSHTQHTPIHFISIDDKHRASSYQDTSGNLESVIIASILTTFKLGQKENGQTIGGDQEKHLLLIESNDRFRETITPKIHQHGYQITAIADGHQAVSLLREQTFDGVVLDLALQNCSAQELLDEWEREIAHELPPVLAFTEKGLSEAEEANLRILVESIVIQSSPTVEQLLDDVALFLDHLELDSVDNAF